MEQKCVVMLLLCGIMTAAGCGGGGGGGGSAVSGDPNAVSSVTLSTSKAVAIANNTDAATVTTTVNRNAGGAVPDGTPVTFTVTGGTATLSDATPATTGGSATVTVRRAPLAATATNETVTVTASAGSVTSAPATIKFITKPDSATVRVGFGKAVGSLSVLVFDLVPGTGATFSSVRGINEAATSNYVGFIAPGVPSNTFTVLNSSGITVPANRDILEFAYNIGQVTTLPTFQVTGNVTATNSTGAPISLTPNDFVVTTHFNTE